MKGCDTIFHLAALIGIPYSYVSPSAYIQTNIVGTNNILHIAKDLKIENIIVTSTSETYGTAQYVPIDENHPAVAQSPYAASKVGADQLALSYCRSFGLPVKIIRPFNTFGPRQSARAIIPTIIIQMLSGKKKIKLGNTSPTRDFTYVKDTARGFVELAKIKGLVGEATNIGMNEEISVKDLVAIIGTLIHQDVSVVKDQQRIRPKLSEVERLVCNNDKILKQTKWRPKYKLKKGLEETIDFIRNNLNVYKPEIYNV